MQAEDKKDTHTQNTHTPTKQPNLGTKHSVRTACYFAGEASLFFSHLSAKIPKKKTVSHPV